jgi:hypothetical protein
MRRSPRRVIVPLGSDGRVGAEEGGDLLDAVMLLQLGQTTVDHGFSTGHIR